jgi:translocation and assembly module TamB
LIISTYHFFHRTTIFITLVLLTLTILFTHKYTLVFLAEKILKSNHIEYSKVEGTLFDGIILYDLKYKDILKAKKIQLNYKLLSFIELKPIIKTLRTQGLYLNLDKIPSTKHTKSINIIPFEILDLQLKNTKFILKNKTYSFNLKSKNITYNKVFNTNKLYIAIKSYYANGTINAKIIKNRIIGNASHVNLTQNICNNYLHFIAKVPRNLSTTIDIDTKRIKLTTFINYFSLRSNKNIIISNQELTLAYFINQHNYKADYNYTAKYLNNIANIKQTATFTPDGEYFSQVNATLIKHPKVVPVDSFDANITGNLEHISFDVNASDYTLNATSKNFNKYYIKLTNKKLKLSFIDTLPQKLQQHTFSFDSYSAITVSPFYIDTIFHTTDKLAKINGTYKHKKDFTQLTAEVVPKVHNKIYKDYNLGLITPMQLTYRDKNSSSFLEFNANKFNVFITKENELINGYGNFASAIFTFKGKIHNQTQPIIHLHTSITSIKKLLHDLELTSKDDKTIYDGKVNINSILNFKNTLSVKSTISAPWLSAKTNSQKKYILKDILIHSSYKDKKINIYNYAANYKDQKFYSHKLSHIHIDKNIKIYVDEFYVFDNLVLKGIIDPLNSRMKLNLHSDSFHLKSHDMNVNVKTNINITVQNSAKQIIDGNITLLSGTISYKPQHDYSISDDDIIVIQDIKKQKRSNLSLNIKINASKAIQYKTKQIDAMFLPDINIRKDIGKKIKYFGKIVILKGKIFAQSKEFDFDKNDKSEIFFSGKKHLNPKLNLKLHFQTIDYKDIIILVTNTLNSPILIFSSNPAMSQNDIMSYILFDEPADTLFDNSGAASKTSINYLILGTGIKTIFNQSTGIKVDTLNILNNANGTLGYEVGARFNKKVRILYKNDISSSIILQYSLQKSLRIDVDVHDTGQGVYFIYTKDFKGF